MPPLSITVHKFGGAALADLQAFRHAAAIVSTHGGRHPVLVVSAMRGVTDTLGEAAVSAAPRARALLATLESRHRTIANGLTSDATVRAHLSADIATVFSALTAECTRKRRGALDAATLDFVTSRGEVLAVMLVVAALTARGIDAIGIDATRLVVTDGVAGNATPDVTKTAIAAAKRWQPARPHSFIHGTSCPCMAQSLQVNRMQATAPTGPPVKK